MKRELFSGVVQARRLCEDICFARNIVCYVFYLDPFTASSRNQLKLARLKKKKKERWEFLKGIQENLVESNSRNTAGSEEGTG